MADLCLGTVQFGMKYGVNNTLGQPTWEQSFTMLDTAIEKNINVIDTARAYGEAELILGEYFKKRKNQNKVQVISKLRPNCIDLGCDVCKTVFHECESSLQRMHLDCITGYLLHTPEYIYRQDVMEAMIKLKEKGLVNNIGVSIYDIKEGEAAIETGIVDFIQLPYSILDQRGAKTGFLIRAKEAGITVFTRSAFLQGLFMMKKNEIPKNLKNAIPYINVFEELIEKYQINRLAALMHFIKKEKGIDYLVFGVDTDEQLREDIEIFREEDIPQLFIEDIKQLIDNVDKSIIFPSLWSNGKKAE